MPNASILIVEDESQVAEHLKLQLTDCGYHVLAIANNGKQAIELAKEYSPDLVLMDIVLPGKLDGIETALTILKNLDVPVIYLTAYADEAFFQRAKVTKPYAYLLKPSSLREIQLTIEIALERHREEKYAKNALAESVVSHSIERRKANQETINLLERITDAFVSLDNNWHYTYVNKKAAQMFGKQQNEMIGKHIWTEFPDGVDQPFYHAYHEAVKTQIPIQLEEYYAPWGGWYENRVYPSPEGLSIFFQDITTRKQTEQKLLESERKFRSLAESAAVGIFIYQNNQFRYVNPRAETLSGYTHNELLRIGFMDIIHPDFQNDIKMRMIKRMQGLEAHTAGYETKIITKQGNSKWLYITTATIEYEGKMAGLGTAYDITEQKQAEQALQENERYNRMLFESSPIGLALCKLDGTLVDINQAFADILGRSIEDTLRLTYWAITPEKYANQEQEQLVSLNETGKYGPYEKEYIHQDGHLVPVLLSGLYVEKGGERFIWSSVENITKRKQAENALNELNIKLEQRVAERTAEIETANALLQFSKESIRKLNIELTKRAEDLEASNQEMEAFSYSVSHDLRAPLRAVQGFAQALLEDYGTKLDATGQDFAQRIIDASSRMDLLIQDLLAYSRLSRIELIAKPIDLVNVVAEAISQIQIQIKESHAQISVIKPMPAAFGNRQTLVQVIANLLSNAIKFVSPGTSPQIRVWAETRYPNIRIWIEDNGIGLPAEHMGRIFQVFERLHGIETYPGTGIGLAIVKKGMERMGGSSGVESEVGKGSLFWLELPIKEEAQ
ncbi:PAS domain S-box protein [Sulfurirhabdus autotrophica]|uniref:histidine kinase n=1 Tax=Sulfurirhabdus autotrophica TaxID=1706046 RepID=A0A4R3Y6I2_9PROT|nr:PAS domain S-box protein [Sulfurirhabdus autotrophica]TCV87437.1 PAS domain S-box-containing protein [Sulfurirhabdus autotrophica]